MIAKSKTKWANQTYINTIIEILFTFLKRRGILKFFVNDFFQPPQIECRANLIQNIDPIHAEETIDKPLKEKITTLIDFYRAYYFNCPREFSVRRLIDDSLLFYATTFMAPQEYYKLEEEWQLYTCEHIQLP